MNKEIIENMVQMAINKYVTVHFEEKKAVTVKIKKFDESRIDYFNLFYATDGSSGMDICSIEDTVIAPGEYKAISTNIAVGLPSGYEIQVRPRSGLAVKSGITVLNSPGTIDESYTGEIMIILINHSKSNFNIKMGDRIAQLVVCKCEKASFIRVDYLDKTDRGDGKFGSTGTTYNDYMDLTSLNYISKKM